MSRRARVGPAIPGIEMTVADNGEILVRGPNIFPGYWQRPAETAKALAGGWFHTGDQGEVDASGNWRDHRPAEKSDHSEFRAQRRARTAGARALPRSLPEAQQVSLIGNQRSFLAALLITSPVGERPRTARADSIGARCDQRELPHYKQIRAFRVLPEPFSSENGLLTANGKLKRDAICGALSPRKSKRYVRERNPHENFLRENAFLEAAGRRDRSRPRPRALQ